MELIQVEKKEVEEFYQNKNTKVLIEQIKKLAEEQPKDVSTKKGREAIASFGRKISSSRVYLEKVGLSLTEEAREKVKTVNAEKRFITDSLNEIRDNFMKELNEFREAEKLLEEESYNAVSKLEKICKDSRFLESIESIDLAFKDLEETKLPEGASDEWKATFNKTYGEAKAYLKTLKIQLEKKIELEKEKAKVEAEKERLRKEQEEFERKKREEEIARKAAEEAKLRAEQEAARERERIIREKQEAIEAEKRLAEEAEKREEEARKRAEREKQMAIEREELARKEEREKIEREKRLAEEAEKKRKEDLEHRNNIENNIALKIRENLDVSLEQAKNLIIAIRENKIENLQINY